MTVQIIKKEIEVTKEANELAESLIGLVKSGKKSLADGFQAGQDLPVILQENLLQLMVGLEGMDLLGEEYEKARTAFLRAWLNAGLEIASLFEKKEEEEVKEA